jgi:hypothetical protein
VFTNFGGGNLPLPQTPTEWVVFGVVVVIVVWAVRGWQSRD